ncbi:MAG TPA: hypothetical protein VN685_10620 [Rhizomicrobium sp.]|nr:hypothetical protein [Rhizomicrobium sp.]
MKRLTWSLVLAASVPLAGCTVGFAQWQSERAKAGAAFLHMRTEQQERANYAACVDRGAMPGTQENLECQLELAKKEQQAATPPSPPVKTP